VQGSGREPGILNVMQLGSAFVEASRHAYHAPLVGWTSARC
jgi:hypothetical protein